MGKLHKVLDPAFYESWDGKLERLVTGQVAGTIAVDQSRRVWEQLHSELFDVVIEYFDPERYVKADNRLPVEGLAFIVNAMIHRLPSKCALQLLFKDFMLMFEVLHDSRVKELGADGSLPGRVSLTHLIPHLIPVIHFVALQSSLGHPTDLSWQVEQKRFAFNSFVE